MNPLIPEMRGFLCVSPCYQIIYTEKFPSEIKIHSVFALFTCFLPPKIIYRRKLVHKIMKTGKSIIPATIFSLQIILHKNHAYPTRTTSKFGRPCKIIKRQIHTKTHLRRDAFYFYLTMLNRSLIRNSCHDRRGKRMLFHFRLSFLQAYIYLCRNLVRHQGLHIRHLHLLRELHLHVEV